MNNSEVKIFVEAGEKIEIISRRFSSIPMTFQFSATPFRSQALLGCVEVHTNQLWQSKVVKDIEIKPLNSIHASMWDLFLTVYVVAECDMEISIPKRGFSMPARFLVIIIGVVVAAGAMMVR